MPAEPELGAEQADGPEVQRQVDQLAKTSIDKQFQEQVRDMLKPAASALFLMPEKVTPDKAMEAQSKYRGTVLKTSLSQDDERTLREEAAR